MGFVVPTGAGVVLLVASVEEIGGVAVVFCPLIAVVVVLVAATVGAPPAVVVVGYPVVVDNGVADVVFNPVGTVLPGTSVGVLEALSGVVDPVGATVEVNVPLGVDSPEVVVIGATVVVWLQSLHGFLSPNIGDGIPNDKW